MAIIDCEIGAIVLLPCRDSHHRLVGSVHFVSGSVRVVIDHFVPGMDIAKPPEHSCTMLSIGHDPSFARHYLIGVKELPSHPPVSK
jgi:hypothetical protein